MPLPSNASESSSNSAKPLAERVRARVAAAQDVITPRRRSPDELHALHRVFCDMGRAQRTARRRTGQMPSPIVRQAAQAFRDAPSLPALVLVAAALDEIGLLV